MDGGWILVIILLLVLLGICIFLLLRNQDTRDYLSSLFGSDAKPPPPSTGKTRGLGSVIAEMKFNKVQPSTTTDSGYDSDPQTRGRRYESKKELREEFRAK